jgi:photosystem II stability/assembly factor-like uncharacterized protein
VKRAPRVLALVAAASLAPAASGGAQEPARPATTNLAVFACTPAGLWRSQDWGVTWQRVEGSPRGDSLKDAGAALSVLATGVRVWAGLTGGLFLSEDFGETWRASGLTAPVHVVLPSRYPQADPTVFAATAEGLLRSNDGGRTFQPTALMGVAVTHLDWPGPALLAATARGVRISQDAGQTFAPVGAGLPEEPVGALALSSFFAADPVAFAGVSARGVFRTSDGGKSWAPSGLEGRTVTDLHWIGPFLYAATDQGLFRSENAGKTWAALGEGLGTAVPRRLLFPVAPASGAEAFLATDNGVFRTGDAGTRWLAGGLRGERVTCLATFPPPSPVTPSRRRR